jgi:hypothetical protein
MLGRNVQEWNRKAVELLSSCEYIYICVYLSESTTCEPFQPCKCKHSIYLIQISAENIMSSKGLVLISGVNGYIAARVANAFLEAGWSVRGTVRKLSSAQGLIDGPLKQYSNAGTFEVAEVPDITAPGAFDNAVKGWWHIIFRL